MQIITIDNEEFISLHEAWKQGRQVGSYLKDGKTHIVIATSHFMIISNEENQKKFAIKPARSLTEAQDLALQFLLQEEDRGNEVKRY